MERDKVAILGQIFEMLVTERQGALEIVHRLFAAAKDGETAGEVVMGGGVVRSEADQPKVDRQALFTIAASGEIVPQHAKHVDVIRIAGEHALEEFDLEIVL